MQRMTRNSFAALALALLLAPALPASPQRGLDRSQRLGLGVQVGSPTGRP